ncbi:MAG: triose-phosphate isomerase [Thermodesulfovibrionales bacterium]|nr:triose-phosphate isomerase [Thermodesulfovibrionales bacterium]
MNKPLIAANWKLNKTIQETESFIKEFLPSVKNNNEVEIVLAPPFTSLYIANLALKDSQVKLAAQNIFYEDKGAFTGEVSAPMLADVGCSYVIIGHSERRQYFNETDDIVNKKIRAARKHNLSVIFCIGESLNERQMGLTFKVVQRQLKEGLRDIELYNITIAYEPIWAIGTGKTATPEQAQEVHSFIRNWLISNFDNVGKEIRIIYGGSVTPENIKSLMNCPDVEGALVGGASLKADSFSKIVNYKF